jgi:hypothetical protein
MLMAVVMVVVVLMMMVTVMLMMTDADAGDNDGGNLPERGASFCCSKFLALSGFSVPLWSRRSVAVARGN